VELRQLTADETAAELTIRGDKVRAIAKSEDAYRVFVYGLDQAPATVTGKGLSLAGPIINLDQLANRLWIEGAGEIPQRQLVINSLRMRPDRIIVGEVRGSEAVDMLQAMNTGHDGSLTTLHANSPRDALSRLETMISMAGLRLPEKGMRQQIASAIDIVIQVARLADGQRKIISI
ncbi:CpaF family protein, partial [Streptococcus pseudopneumoniae]|uniref:CpaF/VirB11 family protein n=1 Tax=Streptococcus pseudopneumoniae TaxID=257758 RepID=UPI00110C2129